MKPIYTTAACLLMLAGGIQAAELQQGERLPKVQLKSLTQQAFTIGKKTLHVVGQADDGATLIANDQGAVGRSNNDVLVSGAKPAEVQARVAALNLPVSKQDYYEATGLSSLHFASFAEAAQAREALQSALPAAAVTLPVEYARRNPR